MQTLPLWSPPQPDLSREVVHLTGRRGPRHVSFPPELDEMTAEQRLISILDQGQILAFPVLSVGVEDRVVCFSEATMEGIRHLTSGSGADPRYEPYGIAFAKQTVFDHGGGPALYVRGDEWHLVSQLPEPLRGRATRFWPGAVPDEGEGSLEPALASVSLWTHEREWRIVDSEGFSFTWDEIAYVLVPDQASWQRIAEALLEPAQIHAPWLEEMNGYGDPYAMSAEDDVRDREAALAGLLVKTPALQPSSPVPST